MILLTLCEFVDYMFAPINILYFILQNYARTRSKKKLTSFRKYDI